MSTANPVFWHLARPRTATDRKRARRMSLGVAGSGALLLAALAILTVPTNASSNATCVDSECTFFVSDLAPYVAESGLRGGAALGALLLIVPFALFALQALRTGTAARERRLAALSLAGATRSDLRRLALLEGTRAALLGALLAGPVYLLLWLILGPALPAGSKLLPRPGIPILLGWLGLLVIMGPIGGLIARQSARPATVSPLGLTRHRGRPLNRTDAILPAASAVLVGVGLALPWGHPPVGLFLALIAIIALAISGSPWLVHLTGHLAARRPSLLTSLAGRRLLADVRTPARVAAVMMAVGVSFGVIAVLAADVLQAVNIYDRSFYLTGDGIAAVGAVAAALVASSALVVGATEQILDNARATAVLVALAASPSFVTRIVRRQMLLVAVPPTALGAVLGWSFYGWIILTDEGTWTWRIPVALAAAVLVATLTAALGALIATMAVRPAILTSSAPENLRTP